MEDWRYENLRDKVGRLQKELREVEGRAYKLETWQMLLPLRVTLGILVLYDVGVFVLGVARAAGH